MPLASASMFSRQRRAPRMTAVSVFSKSTRKLSGKKPVSSVFTIW